VVVEAPCLQFTSDRQWLVAPTVYSTQLTQLTQLTPTAPQSPPCSGLRLRLREDGSLAPLLLDGGAQEAAARAKAAAWGQVPAPPPELGELLGELLGEPLAAHSPSPLPLPASMDPARSGGGSRRQRPPQASGGGRGRPAPLPAAAPRVGRAGVAAAGSSQLAKKQLAPLPLRRQPRRLWSRGSGASEGLAAW
jgi:hypothetical protein